MENNTMPNGMQENKSSVGGMISTIIIIALILLGGLYFWGKRIEQTKNEQAMTAGEPLTADQQKALNEANVIQSTSTSDDTASINADLQSTNLNNLNAELK